MIEYSNWISLIILLIRLLSTGTKTFPGQASIFPPTWNRMVSKTALIKN